MGSPCEEPNWAGISSNGTFGAQSLGSVYLDFGEGRSC